MSQRLMYDSTSVSDIPAHATMIAAYADGAYSQTLKDALARKPKVQVVTITIDGTAGRHVADCENGLLTPDQAAVWAKGEVDAGRHPTIYCSLSPWPTVRRAVADRGLTGKVSYWIAQYNGDPTIPAGAVAKQYLSPGIPGASPSGHFDVSSVAAYWPGVDPPLKPVRPRHLPVHVSAALGLTRRWCDRYTRTATRPLAETAKVRLKRLAASATAATKVKP